MIETIQCFQEPSSGSVPLQVPKAQTAFGAKIRAAARMAKATVFPEKVWCQSSFYGFMNDVVYGCLWLVIVFFLFFLFSI